MAACSTPPAGALCVLGPMARDLRRRSSPPEERSNRPRQPGDRARSEEECAQDDPPGLVRPMRAQIRGVGTGVDTRRGNIDAGRWLFMAEKTMDREALPGAVALEHRRRVHPQRSGAGTAAHEQTVNAPTRLGLRCVYSGRVPLLTPLDGRAECIREPSSGTTAAITLLRVLSRRSRGSRAASTPRPPGSLGRRRTSGGPRLPGVPASQPCTRTAGSSCRGVLSLGEPPRGGKVSAAARTEECRRAGSTRPRSGYRSATSPALPASLRSPGGW